METHFINNLENLERLWVIHVIRFHLSQSWVIIFLVKCQSNTRLLELPLQRLSCIDRNFLVQIVSSLNFSNITYSPKLHVDLLTHTQKHTILLG